MNHLIHKRKKIKNKKWNLAKPKYNTVYFFCPDFNVKKKDNFLINLLWLKLLFPLFHSQIRIINWQKTFYLEALNLLLKKYFCPNYTLSELCNWELRQIV